MAKHEPIEKARSTYANFIAWFKWGSIVVAILAAVVVLIIA